MAALSKREQEVYDLIVTEAMSANEIAAELGIATWTVRKHLRSIFNTIGCESQVQMVVWHYTKER